MNNAWGRAVATVLLITTLMLTAGCGEREEVVTTNPKLDRLTVLMDWYANPDHAAIYGAKAAGSFKQQGLEVDLQVPSDPAAVIKQVEANRAAIGISYQSDLMSARDADARVAAVAALVPTPLNSIIALKTSKINEVKDLAGKTVGTSGAYTQAYLKTILEKHGVDAQSVKQVDVGFNLNPSLISGKVDATIGSYWNIEAVELRLKGRPVTVIPVDKAGSPPYDELILITNEKSLIDTDRANRIRRFVAALDAGEQFAKKNPARVVALMLRENKDLDRKIVAAQLKATLPALTRTAGKSYGYLDPQKWATYAGWMRDNGLLKKSPDVESAYSNELLPGTGPQ